MRVFYVLGCPLFITNDSFIVFLFFWFLTESWGIADRSDSDGGHSGSIDGSTGREPVWLKVVHKPFFCIHGHLVVHKSLGTGIYGHLPASQSFIHSNKASLKPL